jgi:hypothetical protein
VKPLSGEVGYDTVIIHVATEAVFVRQIGTPCEKGQSAVYVLCDQHDTKHTLLYVPTKWPLNRDTWRGSVESRKT